MDAKKLFFRLFVVSLFTSSIFARYTEYLPVGKKCELVKHSYYSLCYNEDHEQANWTIYDLKPAMLNPLVDRTDDFREDPLVSTYSVGAGDYKNSGYDRGHLVPAGSMRFSHQAMSESFFMSNMSPQNPALNRGTWKSMEEQVRTWCKSHGDLVVISGPVLKDNLPQIKNMISIPEFYFKIVYRKAQPKKKAAMLAFYIANKKNTGSISQFVVSVDEVEKATGLDFFSTLPLKDQALLESKSTFAAW
jgi:endonuclease G, mitochondrial